MQLFQLLRRPEFLRQKGTLLTVTLIKRQGDEKRECPGKVFETGETGLTLSVIGKILDVLLQNCNNC